MTVSVPAFHQRYAGPLAVLAVVLEILWLTWLRGKGGQALSAGIFFGLNILTTLALANALRGRMVAPPTAGSRRIAPAAGLIAALLPLALLPKLNRIFAAYPLIATKSDVIPSIQILVRRLLAGEWVYAPITQYKPVLYPTYLPGTWLPYVVPEVAGFDYRLWAFVILLAGLAVYGWLVARRATDWPELLLKAVLPTVLLWGFAQTDRATFGYTVETMVVGYYLLFAASLFTERIWVQALALSLCLLSRFSLLLWLPLWGLMLWQARGWRVAFGLAGWVLLIVGLVYVLPFLSHDWQIFARGQQYYSTAAVIEWEHIDPTITTAGPMHLYRGLGFAWLLYEHRSGSLLAAINQMRLIDMAVSLGFVVLAGIYWWRARPRLDYRLYALLALHLYLAIFYSFIQVPYTYLMLLVPFMALGALAWVPWRPGRPVTGAA